MGLGFRPLNRPDFPLLKKWLSEPHVDAWWRQPFDLAQIENKYGPRIDGLEPSHVFVIEIGKQPVGFIQWYRWLDYPEHAAQLGAGPDTAGLDLAIGEPESIGLGLGPTVIREFIQKIVFSDQRIKAVVTDVEVLNLRSCRAFEKAGFTKVKEVQLRGESFLRAVMRF